MTEDQPFSPVLHQEPERIAFGRRMTLPEVKPDPAPHPTPPEVKPDPAPHPLDVHRDKLHGLVNNIGLTTLDGFRALRDETDDVMRTIAEQQDHVQQQIEKLAEDCRAGLDTVKVVREFFTKLKEQHRVSLPRAASLKLEGDAQ